MQEDTGDTETTSSGWTAGLLLAALALAVLWLGVSAAANASPDLTFRTTDAEHQHHNNKAVVQVSPADPDSYDRAETGPMYRVVFIDGTVLHAFADELHGTGAERLR